MEESRLNQFRRRKTVTEVVLHDDDLLTGALYRGEWTSSAGVVVILELDPRSDFAITRAGTVVYPRGRPKNGQEISALMLDGMLRVVPVTNGFAQATNVTNAGEPFDLEDLGVKDVS